MRFGRLFKLALCGLLVALAVSSIHLWLKEKNYLFSEDVISKLGRDALRKHAKDHKAAFSYIEEQLTLRYPGHILPEHRREWIMLNAGGWMGAMYLLHASLTEYVLFFGTGIDTSGHSGRYWANISDTILTGSFRQWKEGMVEAVMHKPGDTVVHVWGETAGVQWAAGTWMVEYGRGFIPSTLAFALADCVFSTTDFYLMYRTVRIYTLALIQELSHFEF